MTNILLLEGPDGNRYKGTQISEEMWNVKQYLNRIPSGWWKSQYFRQFYMDRTYTTAGDIIHIEEIKPMKKYEQLENQIVEMQKEIDRLKREEKNYPKLKPVKFIRTVTYTPEEYFKYCEESNEEPTEEGYAEYYMDAESYPGNQSGGELK